MNKIADALTLAFTVICMIGLPTYLGYRFNHLVLGILIGGFATISYVLYVAIKQK